MTQFGFIRGEWRNLFRNDALRDSCFSPRIVHFSVSSACSSDQRYEEVYLEGLCCVDRSLHKIDTQVGG
jgi:hypothetical protein